MSRVVFWFTLPKNSVGTKQLKNGAVTLRKIANNARGSLNGATGPQGQQGIQGIQGLQGNPGTAGPSFFPGDILFSNTTTMPGTYDASAVGVSSAESSTSSFVDGPSSDVAVTGRSFSVKVDGPPGAGSTMTFDLNVNNIDVSPCTIGPTDSSCSVSLNAYPIPPLSVLYVKVGITGAATSAGAAHFSWSVS